MWIKVILFLIIAIFFSSCNGQKQARKKQNTNKNRLDIFRIGISEYEFEGIRILQHPGNSNIVVAKIYITGGIQFYDKTEEGIELLALKLAMFGSSQKNSKTYLDEKIEKYGAEIDVSSGYDFSVITFKCLKSDFREVLEIVMERLLTPKFSVSEFSEVRDQYILDVLESEKEPWEKLRRWSLSLYFKDTPLAVNPLGSYESLFSFSNEGLNLFYQNLLAKKRMYVTVVGKIPAEELALQFHQYLKNLPETSNAEKNEIRFFPYVKPHAEIQRLEGNISYLNGIFHAPKPGSLEAIALQLALSILNERLTQKLQIQKGLLTEVFCGYAEFRYPFANIRFSTVTPAAAAKAVFDEIVKFKTESISEEELKQKKNIFLTTYYQNLFENEKRASIIGNAAYHYSWKEELKSAQKVESITSAYMLSVVQKYVKNIQWYFMGDNTRIGRGLLEKPL